MIVVVFDQLFINCEGCRRISYILVSFVERPIKRIVSYTVGLIAHQIVFELLGRLLVDYLNGGARNTAHCTFTTGCLSLN
jgi:hypothetical protein